MKRFYYSFKGLTANLNFSALLAESGPSAPVHRASGRFCVKKRIPSLVTMLMFDTMIFFHTTSSLRYPKKTNDSRTFLSYKSVEFDSQKLLIGHYQKIGKDPVRFQLELSKKARLYFVELEYADGRKDEKVRIGF